MIDVLEDIKKRNYQYLTDHRVEAKWSIGTHGFEFEAQYGADIVKRTLYWYEITDLEVDMKWVELAAIRGLSS